MKYSDALTWFERDSFQVERLNDGVSIALFNPKEL